jgi:hypothetical protein
VRVAHEQGCATARRQAWARSQTPVRHWCATETFQHLHSLRCALKYQNDECCVCNAQICGACDESCEQWSLDARLLACTRHIRSTRDQQSSPNLSGWRYRAMRDRRRAQARVWLRSTVSEHVTAHPCDRQCHIGSSTWYLCPDMPGRQPERSLMCHGPVMFRARECNH